ncbi:MAG TPA: MlaD family protein [Verrucomicrobiae bacterium]|nr:MlaD family protein [Verrucomicrobiae bacterium]
MKNSLETKLGIFFALALIGAFILIEMVGGVDFFRHGKSMRSYFNNVQDLKMGDPVKMAGVQIGKVDKIGFDQNKVMVTFKITDSQAAVKTDSKATIKFLGLMGQNYVAISFGSATNSVMAENDAVLESTEQPDLSALMTKLDGVATGVENITKNFSGDSLNNLLSPFTDFLRDNRDRLGGIITNMYAVSSNIANGEGTVGKLVNDPTLYNTALSAVTSMKVATTQIQGTLDQAKALISDVSEGKGTIGKLMKDEKLYQETSTAMTQLKEILEKVNQGKGTAGKIVNDDNLYKNAKLTLQKLDKATEGLEDQGPLSVIGIIANSLF